VTWLDVVIGWVCLGIGFVLGAAWRAWKPRDPEQ
jgi:hypothetical protein